MAGRDDAQPAYLSEKGPSGVSAEDQDGPLSPKPPPADSEIANISLLQ